MAALRRNGAPKLETLVRQNNAPMKNTTRSIHTSRPSQPILASRTFATSTRAALPSPGFSSLSAIGGQGSPASYFQRPSLPANTVIRFVPQQTAWVVERMGKYSRILPPGLAVLIPFLDRIAYVKSLKESALEIPSQSAITSDNVALDIDGVLYTRVFDAYKARYSLPVLCSEGRA